jgi:hypothetical protein
MSVNVTSRPHGTKCSRKSFDVPKYASSGATTCSPGASAWKTAIVAAIPEANATADAPPSSVATAASSARRLGFASRMYAKPEGNVPSAARWNVVDIWIAAVTAPVRGSGSAAA